LIKIVSRNGVCRSLRREAEARQTEWFAATLLLKIGEYMETLTGLLIGWSIGILIGLIIVVIMIKLKWIDKIVDWIER